MGETTTLVPVTDAHFAWMIAGAPAQYDSLTLPPGGVEEVHILKYLRRVAGELREARCTAAWMMVAAGVIVGLCSYKMPPRPAGDVEIGYGVAASRRRRGHATRAVAAIVAFAAADPQVKILTAETAAANMPSQRVLECNGFVQTGSRVDTEDGPVLTWEHAVAT